MHTLNRLITAALTLVLLLASVAIGNAEPALWVVKGPHATVYLFGTVHVLRKDAPWRSAKIDAALKASKELWLEIPNADDAAAAQPLTKALGVDQEHPLSTKLSKYQLARLDAAAKQAGIPGGEAAFEPLRPWLAAITIGIVPIVQAGYDPQSGVEQILKPEFTQAHKPVHGFETLEGQLHFFADLPAKTEIGFLDSTLSDFDGGIEKFRHLVDAWYSGNVEGPNSIDALMDGEFRQKYPEVYKTLVIDRNRAWIPQITELLKGDGISFVAVGAGHLAGPDSVQSMLEAAGYKVERE